MSKTTSTTTTPEKKSTVHLKSFKSSPEIENFYRFVHDNDLRVEARILIETFLNKIVKKRKNKNITLQ